MKGVPTLPPRKWTEAEDYQLRLLYPTHSNPEIGRILNRTEPAILGRAAKHGLKKPEGFENSGCFKPGNQSHNKGKSFPPRGRSSETQFKKGVKPHSWKPIGSERLSKEGYLQRKIADTGYPPRDWVSVHHIIWKEAGNEIPKGHIVIFKDGNPKNLQIGNLELISMVENMRRNSYHNYGPEIAKLVQLRGAITRQLNMKEKDNDNRPAS